MLGSLGSKLKTEVNNDYPGVGARETERGVFLCLYKILDHLNHNIFSTAIKLVSPLLETTKSNRDNSNSIAVQDMKTEEKHDNEKEEILMNEELRLCNINNDRILCYLLCNYQWFEWVLAGLSFSISFDNSLDCHFLTFKAKTKTLTKLAQFYWYSVRYERFYFGWAYSTLNITTIGNKYNNAAEDVVIPQQQEPQEEQQHQLDRICHKMVECSKKVNYYHDNSDDDRLESKSDFIFVCLLKLFETMTKSPINLCVFSSQDEYLIVFEYILQFCFAMGFGFFEIEDLEWQQYEIAISRQDRRTLPPKSYIYCDTIAKFDLIDRAADQRNHLVEFCDLPGNRVELTRQATKIRSKLICFGNILNKYEYYFARNKINNHLLYPLTVQLHKRNDKLSQALEIKHNKDAFENVHDVDVKINNYNDHITVAEPKLAMDKDLDTNSLAIDGVIKLKDRELQILSFEDLKTEAKTIFKKV